MELSKNQNNLDWFPNYSGASHQVLQRYVYKNQDFLCLVIQYNDQKQGAELIGVNNILYSEDRWRLEKKESTKIKFGDADVAHNTLLLTNRTGNRTLAYWYVIGGRVTANPIIAKIYGLLGSLSGNDSAYLLALAADSSKKGDDNLFNLLLELSSTLQIELSENLREK